jgi:ABC-type sugar transport system ATPase subunit
MAEVILEELGRRWPDGSFGVRDFDLEVADGEFVVLVGPSGCGKTTLLRIVAGLERATRGRVLFDGRDVTGMNPRDRNVAMVFQNYALYPHMTVRGNLEFPLRMAKIPRSERRGRVEETAGLLGLSSLLSRRPSELSGGQRQRVAMGRALVRKPAVFLMDEPLSNLDAKLRVEIRAEIAALQSRLSTTTLYVTHDQVEAMTLGDRIAVLRDGVLQQKGAPRDLYSRPANTFVARFLGSPGMNVLSIEAVRGEGVVVAGGFVPVADIPEGARSLGIRPEALDVASGDSEPSIPGTIRAVEALGHEEVVHLESGLVARLPSDSGRRVGAELRLRMEPASIRFFDEDGRALRR